MAIFRLTAVTGVFVAGCSLLCVGAMSASAQALDFTATRAEVDFSKKLQSWDGFGFNYVETAHKRDLARYLVDWARYLREKEGLPVKYVSLHNEGEDWHRWTQPGLTDRPGHDYNLFWPPEQVVEFIKLLAGELKDGGLADVGVTPGEPSNWYRFDTWCNRPRSHDFYPYLIEIFESDPPLPGSPFWAGAQSTRSMVPVTRRM